MTVQKRLAGSGEPQTPEEERIDNGNSLNEPSRRSADLRTLIQNLKESEKQLNVRCSLLQAVIDGANAAIFSIDPECRYMNFNKKHAGDMRELYGTAITTGEKLERVVPIEKDFLKIHNLARQALAGKDGSASDYFGNNALNRRYFDLMCYPVYNDAGSIRGAAVIAIDTTLRKQREREQSERENLFRRLVTDTPDLLYRVSIPEGKYEYVSPSALTITGYPPEEFFKRPGLLYELVHSSEKDAFGRHLDLLMKGNTLPASEFQAVHKNGDLRWWFVRTAIVRDAAGRPIAYEGMVTDITDRKNREKTLRESEERYRGLADHSIDIIVTFSFTGEITSVSPAVFPLLGYGPDDMIGKNIRELINPESQQRLQEEINRKKNGVMSGSFFEVDLRAKDGRPVPFEVNIRIRSEGRESPDIVGIAREISERKKSEDSLRASEEHFRTLLQSILDAAPFSTFVYEMHEDGKLVFISQNQSANRILGTDCSRCIGKTIEEAFPALASTGIPDACRKAARDGEPFHYDAVDFETEGLKGVFEIHAVPLVQNRISVFFRDVSEKRKAEEELRQSESRFRALILNSAEIIQILDQEKRLVYNSPAFFNILGYQEGSQSRNALDLVHPDDRDRVAADLEEACCRTNPGRPTEYRILASDGCYRYVESVVVNLLGVPGVDGIVIYTHTVDERKRAEQALQESGERFRLIFQHSNDAMYLFEIAASGMPGKIVDANDMAVRQTGFAKDELMQKNLLELCSRDLSLRSRAIMMELLTRGEARFETEKIKKDGSLLPVEISARLAKLKDRTYVIAISRDILQRKREERALRIANQKLQLMNIVAWHDIRNKVTGLRGNVELSKDLATDENLKKFMDSEEDILRVIHRQIQYTKEYQEMGIHPPQWVNIPQVLRMIVSFREIGSLKFRMDLPDLELYCDPIIEKVFSSLIENTRRHGKKATEIHISCHETAGGLLLIYEDDGVGIPGERKKDLFIRGVGSATGFSLFFVHDILEISDMSIQETGDAGTGVRFEISVPKGLYRIGREDA
ncbi:MAG: PAS domain S-box protein [Methanoregula sp.]|nr:PAS domain S-box protein [Methanoregula sp.]